MLLPLAVFAIASLLGIDSTADSVAVARPNYEWSEQYNQNTNSRDKRQIPQEGECQPCKSITIFFPRPHPQEGKEPVWGSILEHFLDTVHHYVTACVSIQVDC